MTSVENGSSQGKGCLRYLVFLKIGQNPVSTTISAPHFHMHAKKVEDYNVWVHSSGYAAVLTLQLVTPEAVHCLRFSRNVLWVLLR